MVRKLGLGLQKQEFLTYDAVKYNYRTFEWNAEKKLIEAHKIVTFDPEPTFYGMQAWTSPIYLGLHFLSKPASSDKSLFMVTFDYQEVPEAEATGNDAELLTKTIC